MKDDRELKIEVIDELIGEYKQKISESEKEIEELRKVQIKKEVLKEMFSGYTSKVKVNDENEESNEDANSQIYKISSIIDVYSKGIKVLERMKQGK